MSETVDRNPVQAPALTRRWQLGAALVIPALLAVGAVPAQSGLGKTGESRAKRALHEVLQPSEAELSKRVTPVVRAVRATADSVFSVLIKANNRLTGYRDRVESQGSGVIIDEAGLALTNWHVVVRAGRAQVEAQLKSGDRYKARVLSASPEYDLALLQLELPEGAKVKPATMGDSSSLMIGETVIAIGNPKGHANTVTVGVLSAEDRSIKVRAPDGRVREYKGLLQTDAAINQGNSGGALLDITGRLIGINNAMSPTSENIGFAIPVNTVRRVFHEVLLSSENLSSVYLGMKVRDVGKTPTLTGLSKRGPAYRAGLRNGDQLLSVNGKRIDSTLGYARAVVSVRPGRPVEVTVRRNGREVVKRPVPMSNAAWALVRRIGAEFETVVRDAEPRLLRTATTQLYRELNQRRPRRDLRSVLRVTRVHPDSPADRLGIQRGDILLGIVDRVQDVFYTRNVINTVDSITGLNDTLHVMANRRPAEYTVWILRDGEVMDGPLEVSRL